jgi:osmotically-inducible protein OsmY
MKTFAESEAALELEHRIYERIAGRVRNLRVVCSEGRVVLEGLTASFHAKQLATHAALEFAPADELINAITVERQVSNCIPSASRRYY